MPPTNIEGIEGGKYQAFGNLGLSFGNRQYLVAGDTCVEMRRTFNLATPCFLSSCKDGFKVIFQTRSSRFAASLLLTCTGLSQMVAPRGPRVGGPEYCRSIHIYLYKNLETSGSNHSVAF